jgi:uncharacterized protein YidB (DUF937 family)
MGLLDNVPGNAMGGSLAQLLPEVINHLTPNGQLPGNHAELLSQGMVLLKSLTG